MVVPAKANIDSRTSRFLHGQQTEGRDQVLYAAVPVQWAASLRLLYNASHSKRYILEAEEEHVSSLY